jgi:hypothetical protein
MTSLRLRGAIFVAVILITATIFASQGKADLPPSVSPDQWVMLGEKAGIVIKKPSKISGRATGELRGQLWLKIEGTWMPTLLEQPHSMGPAR